MKRSTVDRSVGKGGKKGIKKKRILQGFPHNQAGDQSAHVNESVEKGGKSKVTTKEHETRREWSLSC